MRVLRLLVPLFYVLSSLPVQASYHYCLGRVKQIRFYEVNNPNCVCPAEETYSDCCDTEKTVLDFQDDHTSVAKTDLEKPFTGVLAPAFTYDEPKGLMPAETALALRGPPPSSQTKCVYLANCNFRL